MHLWESEGSNIDSVTKGNNIDLPVYYCIPELFGNFLHFHNSSLHVHRPFILNNSNHVFLDFVALMVVTVTYSIINITTNWLFVSSSVLKSTSQYQKYS